MCGRLLRTRTLRIDGWVGYGVGTSRVAERRVRCSWGVGSVVEPLLVTKSASITVLNCPCTIFSFAYRIRGVNMKGNRIHHKQQT